MNPSAKRTQRDYSLAFKLALVDQVEKGELTYKQAQDKYGIQGRSTVLSWLRKHGRLDWSLGTPPFVCIGALPMSDQPTPKRQSKGSKSLSGNLLKRNRRLTSLKQWSMY